MCDLSKDELESYLKKELSDERYKEIYQIILASPDCKKVLEKLHNKLKKDEAKRLLLPHSKAKVDMFAQYLQLYLAILTRVNFVSEINIFDIFCGRGFYENDKEGSPIRAFRVIRGIQAPFIVAGKNLKQINLIINDENPEYIYTIKNFINSENKPIFKCNLESYNLKVEELIPEIKNKLLHQKNNEKNLLFIDPYGYKEIHKKDIVDFLKNGNTEIVLFLPISQMHRFKKVAVIDETNNSYQKLREFINEFFDIEHPITRGDNVSSIEFIKYIKKALSLEGKFYTTSYYIERDDRKNIYALFFITPNIKGFEKILEAKWDLDENEGRGFKINNPNTTDLFKISEDYKKRLEEFLCESPKTNWDLYLFGLEKEFLPKHTNEILKELKKNKLLEVTEIASNKINNRGFYISEKEPKVIIKLKDNGIPILDRMDRSDVESGDGLHESIAGL